MPLADVGPLSKLLPSEPQRVAGPRRRLKSEERITDPSCGNSLPKKNSQKNHSVGGRFIETGNIATRNSGWLRIIIFGSDLFPQIVLSLTVSNHSM